MKADPAIIERLNREFNKASAQPATEAAIQKMAMTPMFMSPAELRSFVSGEIAR